jgi:hypothetical protein
MKTDRFAEFRLQRREVAGNQGNWVTISEKPQDTESFFGGVSVARIRERQVTKVTVMSPDPATTHVTQAASAEVTEGQRQKPSQSKTESGSVTRVTHRRSGDTCATTDEDRAAWAHSITPHSRNPLIPTEVRVKIESIEADARAKGWPPELLYNSNFWDYPRGLAAILDANDEIVEVTADTIAVLKYRSEILRFRRRAA